MLNVKHEKAIVCYALVLTSVLYYTKFCTLFALKLRFLAPHLMLRLNFPALWFTTANEQWKLQNKFLRKTHKIWSYFFMLVIGPSILIYILMENQQCIKMTTLLWCLVKRSYMFRRSNAISREPIWSSQATCMSVCITRRIIEFRVN
jgi:hypothetical protein